MSIETIECAECGKANSDQRKFCAHCGTGLWTSCHQCEAEVSVSEKFCGSCGVNLAEYLAQIRSKFEQGVDEAKQYAAEEKYEDALSCVRVLSSQSNSFLRREMESLRELSEQWQASRERAENEADSLADSAQSAIDQRDYASAVRMLEQISEGQRTDTIRSLLSQAKQAYTELRRLTKQVDEALKTKKVGNLLPILERLIALSSNEAKPRQIAETIRNQLLAVAVKRLAAGQIDEALTTIQRVSTFVDNEKSIGLRRKIENLGWMLRAIKVAPFVDPTLLLSLEKLAKEFPKHPSVQKLGTEIRRRAKQGQSRRPVMFSPWAKSESPKRAEPRYDYFPWFEAFQGSENLDPKGGAYGARFATAAGLALQGLGQAKLAYDFSGQSKKGWMAKVRGSLGKKSATAVGLHFGSTSLKMVRLDSAGSEQRPYIRESHIIGYDSPLSQVVNEFERRDAIRNAMASLKTKTSLSDVPIIASFAAIPSLPRFIKLPAIDPKKLSSAIDAEVKHQIPFGLDEINLEQQVYESDDESESKWLMMVAVRKAEMANTLSLIETLGDPIHIVQDESIATYNLVEFIRQDEQARQTCGLSEDNVIGIINSGGDGTQFLIAHPFRPWFRFIPQGGVRTTRTIASDLKLASAQGESYKREPAKADVLSEIMRSMQSPIRDLVVESERTLASAVKDDPALRPSRFLITGGNSLTPGLMWAFRSGPEAIVLDESGETYLNRRAVV